MAVQWDVNTTSGKFAILGVIIFVLTSCLFIKYFRERQYSLRYRDHHQGRHGRLDPFIVANLQFPLIVLLGTILMVCLPTPEPGSTFVRVTAYGIMIAFSLVTIVLSVHFAW